MTQATTTALFAEARTANAALLDNVNPATTPSRATPAGRAVLAAAGHSPPITVTEPATAVRITVTGQTGALAPEWPAAEVGRPTIWPVVEWSADGQDWSQVADLGPMYPGDVQVKAANIEPGQVRIVEAVGGLDATVTYTAELIR